MIKVMFVAFFFAGVVVECQVRYDPKQYKTALRQMCEKFRAQDSVEDVEKSLLSFVDCFYMLFDPKQNEMDYIGTLDDEHVKKHCDKSQQLKTCLVTLTQGMWPCMNQSFFDVTVGDSGVEMVLNYICYKDDNQSRLFFADSGRECFLEKLVECAGSQKQSQPTSRAATLLSVNDPCGSFNELSACVVTAMDGCSETKHPGNWPSPCCEIFMPSCLASQKPK